MSESTKIDQVMTRRTATYVECREVRPKRLINLSS